MLVHVVLLLRGEAAAAAGERWQSNTTPGFHKNSAGFSGGPVPVAQVKPVSKTQA
jgi:hypothetical protein